MKYIELKNSIEQGAKPIYLLDGEENYFLEKGQIQIKSAFLQEADLNYSCFEGDKLKGDKLKELVDAIYSLPFLSEKRVVCVKDFYPTEKEYQKYLQGIFENPIDSTILLLVNHGAKIKSGGCDLKKKENVTYIDCGKTDENTAAKWIFITCKKAEVLLDANACLQMARYCLCDMSRIEKETEKVILSLGKGGKGDISVIDALVYKDAEYKLYELTQAAARGNYTVFCEVMQDMLAKGYDEISFLSSLASYFKGLYEVSVLKGSDAKVAMQLNRKEYPVKKDREQAARFSKDSLFVYYQEIYQGVSAIKSGTLSPSAALDNVVAKIFFTTR